MSHWHYQVMRHKDSLGKDYYAIHEYYNNRGGREAWTENPVDVSGESIGDLKNSLLHMLNDIDKHGVVDYG